MGSLLGASFPGLGSICVAGLTQLLLLPVLIPLPRSSRCPISCVAFSPAFIRPGLELYVYACLVYVIYVQLLRIWHLAWR
mmetsp:Transcript_29092/g.64331  ORF Transcript_29092/g.64331 Transcript_29092/m.64331 type:complete len:80 (+) Transcript_29092:175-414(+)